MYLVNTTKILQIRHAPHLLRFVQISVFMRNIYQYISNKSFVIHAAAMLCRGGAAAMLCHCGGIE